MTGNFSVECGHPQIEIVRILRLQAFEVRHTQAIAGVPDRRATGDIAQQLGNPLDQALLVQSGEQRFRLQIDQGLRHDRFPVFGGRASKQAEHRQQRQQDQQHQARPQTERRQHGNSLAFSPMRGPTAPALQAAREAMPCKEGNGLEVIRGFRRRQLSACTARKACAWRPRSGQRPRQEDASRSRHERR